MSTDKVYPVLSEGEQHGRPSAPPISLFDESSTAVALQIPEEKAVLKEQEKGLIFSYQNQSTAGGETVYGRPPGRLVAKGIVAGGRSRKGGGRGDRGCWCCCLASFLGTMAAIVLIVGVAAPVLYLVLKPKAPKFSVTEATVNEFKLATGPPGSNSNLNTDVVFSVEARNPNKKIILYYDEVTVKLLYADQQIGQGFISAFVQPHKNTTFLTLPIQGRQIPLASSSGGALQSSLEHDGSIPLQANAVSKVRVKIGRWKSRRHKIHVVCSLQLSNPNTRVSVLSKSCKLKIKFGHITLTF